MLLNKLQDVADFKALPDLTGLGENTWKQTPEELLDLIAKVTTVLLYRLNLPQEEVEEFVSRIKERKMPELFEHFKGYDVQATRTEARQAGRQEGYQAGRQELLVGQVCKKLRRQKSVSEIAEALEEDEATIQRICDIAGKYAPDYDEEEICKEMSGME